MTPGERSDTGQVRCYGCGRSISESESACPHCAAVQVALCACGETNSAYADTCSACGEALSAKSYSPKSSLRRVGIVLLVVLVLVGIGYGVFRLFPRDPYEERLSDYTDAVADFEQGRYDFARVKFAKYLSDHSEYPPARYMLGLSLYRSGRVEEGVDSVRMALRQDPGLDEAAEFLAIVDYESGRYEEALEISQESLDRGRAPFVFHLIAGKVYSLPTHLDVSRAAWHLEQAFDTGEEDPEGLLLLAEHTLTLERAYPDEIRKQKSTALLEKAMTLVADLIREDPEKPEYYFFAARCALAMGNVDKAWTSLKVCLRLTEGDPPHWTVSTFYARLEWMRGNEAGAKRILDELLETQPSPRTALAVYQTYLEQGRRDLAVATIEAARESWPDDPGLLIAAAESDPDQAVELLRRASTIRPGVAQVTVALADALVKSGEGATGAEKVLRDHISEHGHSPLVDLRLAQLILSTPGGERRHGGAEEASELIARADDAIVPGDPSTLYLLLVRSMLRISQRRVEEAASLLAEITSRRPGEPLAHMLLADIHSSRGEYELAVLELTTSLRLLGERPDLLRARAEAQLRMGKDSLVAARMDALRALELDPDREEGLLLLARIEEAFGPGRAKEVRRWLGRAAARPGATARPLIELGRFEARRGDFDEATARVKGALERARTEDERLQATAALAEIERARTGKFFPPGAREAFETRIRIDPDDWTTRLRYAALLLDAGDFSAARKWAAEVTEEDPGDTTALAILFECALAEKDRPAAADCLERLIVAEPGGPAAAYARGRLALADGKPKAAVGFFERARDGAPGNVRSVFFLGVAQFRAGDLADAQEAFERTLELSPSLLSARRALAEVVADRGRKLLEDGAAEKAIPLLQKGLSAAPDHLDLLALLVEAQYQAAASGDLGLLDMHEEDCKRLIKQLEKSKGVIEEDARIAALRWALGRLGMVHLANNDWDAVLETVDAIRAIDPGLVEVDLHRGLVLLLAGRPEEAAGVLEAVVKERPEDWTIRRMLCEAFLRSGRTDAAVATVRDWLDARPRDAAARSLLGRIRERMGDRQAALEELTAALEIDPDRVEAAEALLELRTTQGRVGDAIPTLTELLSRTGYLAEIHSLLGRARLSADARSDAGLAELTEALRIGFKVDRFKLNSILIELRVLLLRDELERAMTLGREFDEWVREAEGLDSSDRSRRLIAEAYCLAGVAFRRSGKFDLAEHRYRKALEASPDFPMALNNLAEVLTATAETRTAEYLVEAVDLAERAVEADPEEAGYRDTLALAYLKSGRIEDAAKAYQGVASLLEKRLERAGTDEVRATLTSGIARAEAGLAASRLAAGDREGAARAFRRALSRDPRIARDPIYREIAALLE